MCWSVVWWFCYDKNSAITAIALYLPIEKCKQNGKSWKVYTLNNKKTFSNSITILK